MTTSVNSGPEGDPAAPEPVWPEAMANGTVTPEAVASGPGPSGPAAAGAARAEPAEIPALPADQGQAMWSAAQWHGKMLVDCNGDKIGRLQDVYVDVETDEPQFATVKEGIIGRHLTFVPLGGIHVGPDDLRVSATKDQVRAAPDLDLHGEELSQQDESALYHHFELNYTPPATVSGRRLARR